LSGLGPAPSEAGGKVVFFVPHDYDRDKFTMTLTADEKYGFGFTKTETIPVRIVSPILTYSFSITDMGMPPGGHNGIIDPSEIVTLSFKVKNSGEASAQGVKIAFAEPKPEDIIVNKTIHEFGEIKPGAEREGELKFTVRHNASADKLKFPFIIQEEYGRGAKDTIDLALGSKQDTDLPVIKVHAPRDKSYLSSSMMDLDIEITDNVALADPSNISLKLNQEPVRSGDVNIRQVGNVLQITGKVPAAPGDNSLVVLAKDQAGNRASERVTVFARREEKQVEKLSGPEIVITSPSNDARTDRETVALSARIRDDKAISEYKLFVNGNLFRGLGGLKSEQQVSQDRREVTLNIYVPLQNGQNTIELVATDSDNLKKSEVVQVNYSSIGEIWAVVVGISKYKDRDNISSLEYADADARAFYDFLINQYGGRIRKENVRCLINEDATGENIREALKIFLKRAISNDIVVIYFAGHGGPAPHSADELYLIPYDAYYQKIAAQGIPMYEISRILNKEINAERVVMIADACHSGALLASADDIKTRALQETANIMLIICLADTVGCNSKLIGDYGRRENELRFGE
jgi:hypothetical protein